MRRILTVISLLSMLALSACFQSEGQFGSLLKESFSTTPRCGITDRIFNFNNTMDEPLDVAGIALSPGTNGAGHFSIQGFQIGSDPEMPADISGGISPTEDSPIMIPAGAPYALRVRYSPLEQSGDGFHAALIDMSFMNPAGVVQIEVFGDSQSEGDCPDVVVGQETGLTGDVDLTVTFLVASTGALAVPLSSDLGVTPFQEVKLSANIDGTTFTFPAITAEDNFFLPAPNPATPGLGPLLSIVSGDTDVTSASSVTGTFDAATGKISLPGVAVTLADNNSVMNLNLNLTTDPIDPGGVPNDRVVSGGFQIVDGQAAGRPVQADGTVHLVAATTITDAQGPLASGIGSDILVRIEATILCPNGTTECSDPEP